MGTSVHSRKKSRECSSMAIMSQVYTSIYLTKYIYELYVIEKMGIRRIDARELRHGLISHVFCWIIRDMTETLFSFTIIGVSTSTVII